MVEQLLQFVSSKDIHILDNNSTYPPMVEYLKSIDSLVCVHRFHINHGHYVVTRISSFTDSNMYIITDPDLTLNPNLPKDFISQLVTISNIYKTYKTGFALDISNNIRTDITFCNQTPMQWESQFWHNKIPNDSYELYASDIDTTFCLINTKYSKGIHIRIAGNFTCIHRPWLIDWRSEIPEEELKYYLENNKSSSWIK
jgi:hypothetical protein